MKNILLIIWTILFTKLIEDNLPNFHYKNIKREFDKRIIPFLLLASLGYFSILYKLTKDKETQKSYIIFMATLTGVILLSNHLKESKKVEIK